MPDIDIDAIVPWDLTITARGQRHAPPEPTWDTLLKLAEVQHALAGNCSAEAAGLRPELGDLLRDAVGRLVPGLDVAGLGWGEVMGVFNAAAGYYQSWMKKKQEAILDAATGGAEQHPPASTASASAS